MVTILSKKEDTEEQKEADDNNPARKKPVKKKKIVVIGARIHPGETPSSYVCQGMINFLLGESAVAEILRENVTFKFIPMLNPDGVFVGNYRTCILGQDLNRCWQETSIHAYPTLAAVKSVIDSLSSEKTLVHAENGGFLDDYSPIYTVMAQKLNPQLKNGKEEEMDMYLDLHAHTGLLGAFVYGNTYSDVYRFQRHTLFPKHLSYCAQDFSLENTAYNKDRNKSGTSRRFLSAFLNDKVNCYTLEVSFHGYEVQKGNATAVSVYNEEDYLRLGESICHSLLDYYCATKYIPAETIPGEVRDTLTKTAKAKVPPPPLNGKSPNRAPTVNKAPANPTLNGKSKDNGNKVSKSKASSQSKSLNQLQPKIVDIKEPTLPT